MSFPALSDVIVDEPYLWLSRNHPESDWVPAMDAVGQSVLPEKRCLTVVCSIFPLFKKTSLFKPIIKQKIGRVKRGQRDVNGPLMSPALDSGDQQDLGLRIEVPDNNIFRLPS